MIQEAWARARAAGRFGAAVAGTAVGAIRPRRPTGAELNRVVVSPLPTPTTIVRLRALPQHPRHVPSMLAEGCGPGRLRIGLRTFIVDHPRARILLEPAVATQVRSKVLRTVSPLLRRTVTPPADVLSTVESLHLAGVDPATIDLALPTHLHWDHVSGLLDLPRLEPLVHVPEWGWAMTTAITAGDAVRAAVCDRPISRYDLDGPPVLTFPRSHDLFGDGAVVLVDLAGHTPGSVGVLLATDRGPVLMAGDAAWHHLQVERGAQKAAFPGRFVDDDREQTYQTLVRLHVAARHVTVLPTHDHDRASLWEKSDHSSRQDSDHTSGDTQ